MKQRWAFAAVLATALLTSAAGLARAQPLFACASARTFREKAVCRDARLAGLDKEIAAAYSHALSRFDPAGAAALRQDQRYFLAGIDEGFDHILSFPHTPEPTEEELDAELKDRSQGGVTGLEDELKRRLVFLKSLDPVRATPVGRWESNTTAIAVTPGKGAFVLAFDATSFGWTRYNCQFEARFVMRDGVLRADVATNKDIDQDRHSQLTLSQRGATLELREVAAPGDAFDGWTCPHRPELHEVLLPVRSAE